MADLTDKVMLRFIAEAVQVVNAMWRVDYDAPISLCVGEMR